MSKVLMWPPDFNRLKELPPPYEIFEPRPCEPVSLTVVDWLYGKLKIHPRWPGAPEEKWVAGCRVYIPEEEKETFPYYYDMTATTLVAQLIPILRDISIPPRKVKLKLHKIGLPPKARYSVEILEII